MKCWRLVACLGLIVGQLSLAVPVSAANLPYFQAVGGDISAGASFYAAGGTGCSNGVPAAGIAGWSNHADHSGAGTNYGESALGFILDAVSAQGSSHQPSYVSFTNTANNNEATGNYGGQFDAAPCIDYWKNKPAGASSSVADFGPGGPVSGISGNYVHTGNVILTASSIADGNHSTLYVDGDVAIIGNITYASTTWSSRSDIPSFRLVAKGTIYIDASVTQLDGTYAAVPDSNFATAKNEFSAPLDGTITTCAIGGFSSYNPTAYLANRIESACSKRLTINGSLSANQIWFLRSTGSIDGPKQAAETVNFVPDTWIAPGSGGTSITVNNSTYQSIIGLPPVL